MPNFFEFIRNETGHFVNQTFSIVGHSTGTATNFAGLIKYPEIYGKNLNLIVGLGPFTKFVNTSPINVFLLG